MATVRVYSNLGLCHGSPQAARGGGVLSVGKSAMVGRPNLSPSDQATFEAVKAKLKEVPPMSDKD